jgi:hypothetical protein
MSPIAAFRMAWHATGWINTWACEGYSQITGLPSPTGTEVIHLPYEKSSRCAVDRALSELRERRSRTPLKTRWHYRTAQGVQTFESVSYPIDFDESGRCCQVFGIFSPVSDLSISLEREVLGRWISAQPTDLMDFITKYAVPHLDGSLLKLEFECEAYAEVINCQRSRLIESPEGLPSMTVICCSRSPNLTTAPGH